MTAASAARRGEDLCHAYLQALQFADMYVGPPVVSVTRTFFDRIGPDAWATMTLEEQCQLPAKYRRTVGWLIVTGRLTVSAEYLVRVPAYLGGIAKWALPDEHAAFTAMAADLGFGGKSLVQQWSAMAKAAGIHGTDPAAVTAQQLLDARDRLVAAMAAPETYRDGHALSRDFHRKRSGPDRAVCKNPPRKARRTVEPLLCLGSRSRSSWRRRWG